MDENTKFVPGEYDITHEGEVVGKAAVDENGKISEASVTAGGIKRILPGYDPTAGLSIAYKNVERVDVVSAYPDWDVEMMEAYRKDQQKGTFDA